jgi:NADPH:quinone reductase-like Zn-dependent oxidoreductase
MQAAVVVEPGQAPEYRTFPDPVPQEGEVLVRVRAAGLHPVVRAIASGSHYASAKGSHEPFVPGVDGVGVLEDGRRVYFGLFRRPWGTMAERAPVLRTMFLPLPENLDDAVAAAIANPGMSSWVALDKRAGLSKGETVLIMGATGVAGQLAIQTARLLGAKRVIAAGRNVGALAAADVDAVIALNQPEDALRDALAAEAAAGIDVVVDYLWGRPTELVLEALARGFKTQATRRTRLIEIGSSAGKTITLPAEVLRSIDLTLLGSGFGSASLEAIFATIPKLFDLAAAGSLQIAVDRVPLANVASEWNRAESGRRIVFTV